MTVGIETPAHSAMCSRDVPMSARMLAAVLSTMMSVEHKQTECTLRSELSGLRQANRRGSRYRFVMGVQIGGDADTDVSSSSGCLFCGVRAAVDQTLVRIGVERLTMVVEYVRARVGPATVERARCHLSLGDGRILHGEGAAREDAILDALCSGGVTP
jgi:hypothetical protein